VKVFEKIIFQVKLSYFKINYQQVKNLPSTVLLYYDIREHVMLKPKYQNVTFIPYKKMKYDNHFID